MSKKSSSSKETPLKTDILLFYDDFVEFQDYCSFMCEAFSSLASEDNFMDESTAMGASRFCHWMKRRMHQLKGDLKKIHKKANTQSLVPSIAQKQKDKRKKSKSNSV